MKKLSFIAAIFLLIANNLKSQENAFYVNDTKVTELTCYDFDQLSFKFEIDEEMFGYDQVVFSFKLLNSEKSSGGFGAYFKNESQEYIYACIMTKSVFSAKYKGKTSGEIVVFEKGVNDSYKFSDASSTNSMRKLSRTVLQYTSRKNFVDGAKIQMRIMAGTFKGYVEYVENGYVKKKESYDYKLIKDFAQNPSVELKNRMKVSTGNSNEFQKEVTHNGDCYPSGSPK